MSTFLPPVGWTASDVLVHQQALEIQEQCRLQRLKVQSARLDQLETDIKALIEKVSFSRRLVDRMCG